MLKYHQARAVALLTIFSTVKPNSLNSLLAGALAPKWSIPMALSALPVHLPQPMVEPASMEIRLVTLLGKTSS